MNLSCLTNNKNHKTSLRLNAKMKIKKNVKQNENPSWSNHAGKLNAFQQNLNPTETRKPNELHMHDPSSSTAFHDQLQNPPTEVQSNQLGDISSEDAQTENERSRH